MKLRELLLLAGGVAAAAQASALSLGNTQDHVQLGAPIDLVFPFQADADKTADSSCLKADVWMGDTPLGSGHITLTPQGDTLRLRTRTPVYEPLVTVNLQAGCTGSISRNYTFFADPPRSMAASVEPIDLNQIQVSTVPAPTIAAASVSASAASSARPAASTPSAAPRKARPAKKSPPPAAAAAAAAAAPAALAAAPTPSGDTPSESSTPTPAATAPSSTAEQPRLRVEPIEGLDTPAGTASEASGGDSTLNPAPVIDPQTQMLLDANAARLEAFEKQLLALQTQLTNNRTEITSLQTQLVQAQNQGLPIWVYVVLAALAAALATIAWLLQRLKQERLNAQRTWADTVLAVEDSDQATSIDTQLHPFAPVSSATANADASSKAPALAPVSVEQPAWNHASAQTPTQIPEELYSAFAQPAPGTSKHAVNEVAEVLTAQALFDIQEQAEFYASIGENDQAIEILQSHIAKHASSSPLAYIELLQLLYRLSRTDAFEQVRAQFQAHFNVNVPDFLGFSRKGHDLWNGYPDVLGKVEALWPTDEVQGLLRSLIVRSAGEDASATSSRFDLSAFDDLLMLYTVVQTTPASSRGQMPGRTRTAPEEVPLPDLNAASAASVTAPAAVLGLHSANLDMLHAAADSSSPLATGESPNDSPFQSPLSHFSPDEALMDGLSLQWDSAVPPSTPEPTATPPASFMVGDAFNALDADLSAFSMDERDLPPQRPKP